MSKNKFQKLETVNSQHERTYVDKGTINSSGLPTLYTADPDLTLPEWIADNRADLRAELYKKGAILFRSERRPDFGELVSAFSDAPIDYKGGAAIRSRVDDSTYTASEYPEELEIRLHSEFCYSNDWPMLLFFQCDIAPSDRGQTPIADNRKILADMPDEILAELAAKKLMYVRGYGYNRTWQRSYETESRQEVEELCAREGRTCEWTEDGGLRTREVRPAFGKHPVTGESVWFNYAHGFHISRMDDGIREALSTSPEDTDEQLWPNNVLWGDGTPIDAEVIDVIQRVVESNSVQFDWQVGDTLIVDNMLCSHARRAYSGPRKILLKVEESHLALTGKSH